MNTPDRDDDPIWQTAWQWVTQAHEQPLSAEQLAELKAWLGSHPAHRQTYDEAARLWLLAGLVPPVHVKPE
ncbi:DUF4880 domain-containing protein [Aquabacterium sp. CECT 9606]|uniref:FecR/PupR family sigma factor regulator n=1 Tax=Aquabacterium sp. CECT 9606 TaxID=2845822 RepID=UPI001E35248B|nr:DUF4880 domain-containing protein [Aquabacterium sp. CECT 9606]CAH0355901.1 hypothetical protein AQB9606_04481 [Aquabacterium sp. CECT 9606]